MWERFPNWCRIAELSDPHELALFYSALLEKEITFESDDFSTINWTTSGSRCSASRDSSPRRGPR